MNRAVGMNYDFLDRPMSADHHGKNAVATNDDRRIMNDLLSLCRSAMSAASGYGSQAERIDQIASHVERLVTRPVADTTLTSTVSQLAMRMERFEDSLTAFMQKVDLKFEELALKFNAPLAALNDAVGAFSEKSAAADQRSFLLAEQIFELVADHKSSDGVVSAEMQERLKDISVIAGEIMRRPEKDQAALIAPLIEVIKSVAELKGDIRGTTSMVESGNALLAALPQSIAHEFKLVSAQQEVVHGQLRETVAHLQQRLAETEDRIIHGIEAQTGHSASEAAGLLTALQSIATASTSVLKSVNRLEDSNLSSETVERLLNVSQGALRDSIASLSAELETHQSAMSKEIGSKIIEVLPAIEKIASLCGQCVSEAASANVQTEATLSKANEAIAVLSRDVEFMPVKLVASLNSFATKQDLVRILEPVASKIDGQAPEFAHLAQQIEQLSQTQIDANQDVWDRTQAALKIATRDVTVNVEGLRDAVQHVRDSALSMQERIDVHVAPPVVDLAPAMSAMQDLASRIDNSHSGVVAQANSAIMRIEEMEKRREDHAAHANEIGKDGMSRILVGFRLLMEKVEHEAVALGEAVADVKARAAAQIVAHIDAPNTAEPIDIGRFERAASILAEAVATIEPTVQRSVHQAMNGAMGSSNTDDSNQLLGRLMLSSISRVNLLCTDVQEALTNLQENSTSDASVLKRLNDLAVRTRDSTGQLIDVAAAIEADILTFATPAKVRRDLVQAG
jgi:DNA-binding FrmR family transcriptional regulator